MKHLKIVKEYRLNKKKLYKSTIREVTLYDKKGRKVRHTTLDDLCTGKFAFVKILRNINYINIGGLSLGIKKGISLWNISFELELKFNKGRNIIFLSNYRKDFEWYNKEGILKRKVSFFRYNGSKLCRYELNVLFDSTGTPTMVYEIERGKKKELVSLIQIGDDNRCYIEGPYIKGEYDYKTGNPIWVDNTIFITKYHYDDNGNVDKVEFSNGDIIAYKNIYWED